MASQIKELPADALSDSAVDSFNSRTGAVVAQADDYAADQITNTPAGNISSTDVQAALNELDTLKRDSAFTPSVPSDWDTSPNTIQEALDELAARLRILE